MANSRIKRLTQDWTLFVWILCHINVPYIWLWRTVLYIEWHHLTIQMSGCRVLVLNIFAIIICLGYVKLSVLILIGKNCCIAYMSTLNDNFLWTSWVQKIIYIKIFLKIRKHCNVLKHWSIYKAGTWFFCCCNL